jgi:hypothetical protein
MSAMMMLRARAGPMGARGVRASSTCVTLSERSLCVTFSSLRRWR